MQTSAFTDSFIIIIFFPFETSESLLYLPSLVPATQAQRKPTSTPMS